MDMSHREVINRLKSELATSKSVQSELSADTADMQGDLGKPIVKLFLFRII